MFRRLSSAKARFFLTPHEIAQLKKSADDIRKFARNLIGQGVQAQQLTTLISHLNDVLTARLIEIYAAKHQLNMQGRDHIQ